MDLGPGPWERAQIPNTNLSESVHASWLAGKGGNKKKIFVRCMRYRCDQCLHSVHKITQLFNWLIYGDRSDMHTFLERVSSKKTPSPTVVARVVQGAVAGTPLHENPILFGDKETVQRKRARSTIGKSSHRPGFEMESRQRKERGRPRKIAFEGQETTQDQLEGNFTKVNAESTDTEFDEDTLNNDLLPQEMELSNCKWAIRRMPTHCVRKCFGIVQGKRCKSVMQSRSCRVLLHLVFGESVPTRVTHSNNGCGFVITMFNIPEKWLSK